APAAPLEVAPLPAVPLLVPPPPDEAPVPGRLPDPPVEPVLLAASSPGEPEDAAPPSALIPTGLDEVHAALQAANVATSTPCAQP
ncbi:MAG: hypothetical protein M3O50_18280, partial [Myxococcota bacterium]|nr:hypothetical protein [Myxococcota bacterium]